jgi:hypothetical protein
MQMAMDKPFYRSRWWMPAFSVFLGLIMLAAFWIGGNPWDGLGALGIMTAVGAMFLLGSRSETLQGLGGPGRDERWAMIDIHATALTGIVLVAVIIGAFLVEVAQGQDGQPWSLLGAVGGLAYIISVALLRHRS